MAYQRKQLIMKVCICGREFKTPSSIRKFCSGKCRQSASFKRNYIKVRADREHNPAVLLAISNSVHAVAKRKRKRGDGMRIWLTPQDVVTMLTLKNNPKFESIISKMSTTKNITLLNKLTKSGTL